MKRCKSEGDPSLPAETDRPHFYTDTQKGLLSALPIKPFRPGAVQLTNTQIADDIGSNFR